MQRSCGVAIAWSCNYMHIRTFQFPYMYIYNYPLSVFTIRVSTHRTYIYICWHMYLFSMDVHTWSLYLFFIFFVKEEKNWHFSNMCWPSSFTKTNLILSSLIIFFKITLTLEGEFLINLNIYKKNINI